MLKDDDMRRIRVLAEAGMHVSTDTVVDLCDDNTSLSAALAAKTLKPDTLNTIRRALKAAVESALTRAEEKAPVAALEDLNRCYPSE